MSSRVMWTLSIQSAHMEDTGVVLIQDMIIADPLSLLIIEYIQRHSKKEGNSSLWRMIAVCSISRALVKCSNVSAKVNIAAADDTVSVTCLPLLLRCEMSNQMERALIVYGIGLVGFDNHAKRINKRFSMLCLLFFCAVMSQVCLLTKRTTGFWRMWLLIASSLHNLTCMVAQIS